MIDITIREYNAIVYAYARLAYIVENDEQVSKSDKDCVNVLDKFLDKIPVERK